MVPDLLETTKRVRPSVTLSSMCLIGGGIGRVQHEEIRESHLGAEHATHGPRRAGRPARAEDDHVTELQAPDLVGERPQLLDVAAHHGGRREPAQSIAHRLGVPAPERGILHPEAIEEVVRLEEGERLLGHGVLERIAREGGGAGAAGTVAGAGSSEAAGATASAGGVDAALDIAAGDVGAAEPSGGLRPRGGSRPLAAAQAVKARARRRALLDRSRPRAG